MRLRTFPFWSVAAVVAALTTYYCTQPGKTRTSDVAARQPSATSNLVNPQPEFKLASVAQKAEPYLSGDIKVIPVDRKEKNARFVYDLDISYPQIEISFGEYQVGPGCLGLVRVLVSYDHLQRILRRAVKWLHLRH